MRSESEDFYDQPSDGLLGLAFGTIAQSKQSTFFENLMMQKQVAAGAFAVHLARGQATGSEVRALLLTTIPDSELVHTGRYALDVLTPRRL